MNAWPLAVFCVTVAAVLYLVIWEPRVTVPAKWTRCGQQLHISLSYGYAPLLGVAVLLAAGAANGDTLRLGIAGDRFLKPYGIVILFMSQAYLCTSLDATGVFAYIAAHVTRRAGTGGHKVFAMYFLLASALTVFTSNDVVILTITPIIIHFAKATKSDPLPLLFLEFYAANTWGMTLLIGNPTNVIIGEAVDLSFLAFSKWSLLPTLVAGLATYGCLLAVFWRYVRTAPEAVDDVDPSSLLRDPWAAKLGCGVLLASLVMLAVANFIDAPLWTITLAAAGVLVAGNVWVHIVRPRLAAWRQRQRDCCICSCGGAAVAGAAETPEAPAAGGEAAARAQSQLGLAADRTVADGGAGAAAEAAAERGGGRPPAIELVVLPPPQPQLNRESTAQRKGFAAAATGAAAAANDNALCSQTGSSLQQRPPACSGSSSSSYVGGDSPTQPEQLGQAADDTLAEAEAAETQPAAVGLWTTFAALPWHVVLFLFGMFILVEALNEGGWVDYFGKALAGATNSTFAAVFLTGAIGSLLANVLNNQPMTILMARILLSKGYDVPARHRAAANLSLIAASNVGANFSLIGSLAAVMWVKLLKAKSVEMSFLRFLKMGLLVMTLPLALSLLVFWGEAAAWS